MKHFPHFLWSLMTAGVIGTVTAVAAPPADDVAPRAPNLALSASFAPVRYVVSDSIQRERLLEFLRDSRAGTGDSVESFAVRGNTFTLSRRWITRLAAQAEDEVPAALLRGPGDTRNPAGESRERHRRRARQRLELVTGGPIEEAGAAFPAGYLPGEASYIHNATAEEEGQAHCRRKPMWPYLETSVLCGSVPGADINMAAVWERFDGADTLVIAVLDAGLDFLHQDLQGRWAVNEAEANGLAGVDDDGNGFVDDVRGWDFVDDDNDAQDYNGHGTMTSGVIAAGFDNGIGIPGMLPRVKILPVRVLSTAGFGNAADIAAGIRYAVARGAHVLNFSIGMSSTTTDAVLRNAFLAARDAGVIVAAASGNDGLDIDGAPRQPFSYGFSNVYGVASYNQALELSGFSNYGATKIDIAAPGDHIVTTGIPPALTRHEETFEAFTGSGWSFTGSWTTAADPVQGGRSLQWVSGNVATAALNGVDLRGKRGGLLRFRLSMQPAGSNDGLDVYVVTGNDTVPVSGLSGVINNEVIAVNLGAADDSRFDLVFRACSLNRLGNCSNTTSSADRALRIDNLRITHADMDSAKHDVITFTGGTSLAAPFFAGYAGLVRLAADRTGVPLTRALVLAGAKAEPGLAGKVATGGRLDAAKGLAFYLNTLPRITVTDSLETAWTPGAAVAYALTVRDGAGPRDGYAFSPIDLPAGGSLSSGGVFAWNTGGATNGTFAVRAKAVNGPHVLRSLTTFTVGTATPVIVAAPGQASRLRVGGRLFLLPASAFEGAGRPLRLRLELYGADGKTLRTLEGPLVLPAGARVVDYDLTGARGVGARAWLDGVALRPARD